MRSREPVGFCAGTAGPGGVEGLGGLGGRAKLGGLDTTTAREAVGVAGEAGTAGADGVLAAARALSAMSSSLRVRKSPKLGSRRIGCIRFLRLGIFSMDRLVDLRRIFLWDLVIRAETSRLWGLCAADLVSIFSSSTPGSGSGMSLGEGAVVS